MIAYNRMPLPSSLICSKQLGHLLGVHWRTAQRLVRSGEIPAFQVRPGGPWRTTREAYTAYVARQIAAGRRRELAS